VTGLGSVYYEPQTDITADNLDPALLYGGFNMPFTAPLLEIDFRAGRSGFAIIKGS